MGPVFTIYKREVFQLLHSFIAYLLVALFISIASYFFLSLTASFSIMSQQWNENPGIQNLNFNLTEMVLTHLYSNVAVLVIFFVPVITMRSFSEEKKQGTLELLLTLPVRDWEVVVGKYLSMMTLFFFMAFPLFLYPILIQMVGGYFEWGTVLTGFLGVMLLGASFMAIGIFCSSLTENQIVAAVVAFSIMMFLWVIGWIEGLNQSSWLSWTGHLSALNHYRSLVKGVLEVKDVIYYSLLTLFFLMATIMRLEMRVLSK